MAALSTVHFDESIAENEIKNLIFRKGIDNLTSEFIINNLEEKFGTSMQDFKNKIDGLVEKQIEHIRNFLFCKTEAENSIGLQNNAQKATNQVSFKKELDGDVGTVAYAKAGDVSPKSKIPPRVKRSPPSPTLAENEISDDAESDLASLVKRRRRSVAHQTVQKREISKKKEAKSRGRKDGKPKRTMFQKICVVSDDLFNLTGKRYMRRSDVVKWMWNYFKTNNLKDPRDGRMIILDEPLQKIFGSKRIRGFSLMQNLKKHVKDNEFLDAATREKIEAELDAEMDAKNDEAVENNGQNEENERVEEETSDDDERPCRPDAKVSTNSVDTTSTKSSFSTSTPTPNTMASSGPSNKASSSSSSSDNGKNKQKKVPSGRPSMNPPNPRMMDKIDELSDLTSSSDDSSSSSSSSEDLSDDEK